jgi:dCTP deaminase
MVLSDRDIIQALRDRRIVVTPKPDLKIQLGSCSLDLRLGKRFRIFNHSKIPFIDPNSPRMGDDMMTEIRVKDGEPFILQPGDFVLATTMETITIPNNLLARLEGRSSLGRLGIVVHSTASVFDPGWHGICVLELGNLGRMPIALYPGMRICALTFEELKSPSTRPYNKKPGAKYVKQSAPLASRIAEEKK